MKTTIHIGEATAESAFITLPSGHDIARLERITPHDWPDLEPENYTTDDEWQSLIDAVDEAHKLRARVEELEGALRQIKDRNAATYGFDYAELRADDWETATQALNP